MTDSVQAALYATAHMDYKARIKSLLLQGKECIMQKNWQK
jgi:hypothetical protein